MRKSAYGLFTVAAALAPLSGAYAADTHVFNLAAQPLREALVSFAVQAGVSISTENDAGCAARSRAVRGRMTTAQGLARLLEGSGCTWRLIDPTTVQIVSQPPQRRPATVRRPPPPAPTEPVTVRDVLVTATKRTIGLARAPYAISSVDGGDLTEAGQADMADIAGRVASVTFTNLGPGRNKIFVRGLSDGALTGRTQSTVGLYLDDTRLTYNAPDPDLRLVDIERVELLRGPQGSLYGAGSIGGILQVVTRAPDLRDRSGWISVEGSATAGGNPGAVVEGGVNMPLVADRLAVRLVGYRETAGGYVDDVSLRLSNIDETTRQGGRIALRFRYNPRWSVSAGFAAQTIHSADTHYALDSLGSRQRANFIREPHRNDFDASFVTLEGDLGWARLKANVSLQSHGLDSTYDATLARPHFASGGMGPVAYREAIGNKASVSEITLSSPADRRLSWIAGVFLSEYTSTLDAGMSGSGPELYSEARRDHIDETALYGEATWRATDRFSLTAGGRLFRLGDETTSEVAEPVLGNSTAFDGRARETGFAPKLVASFEASDNLLIYAQAAEGYRAGGYNTSGRTAQVFDAPGAAQPFRRFTSDELWNYEAGVRLGLMDGALHLRAAVFRAQWRNIQADQLLPSGLPFTANLGDGHNTGVEAEAAYRRGPWRLEANVLFNDPELQTANGGVPVPQDRSLPGVARLQFGTFARYETTIASMRGVVSLEASYVGSSQLTFDTTTAPTMGDYWTTRLSGALSGDRWTVKGWVENLLNADGDTFAYGNPFSLRIASQATPQRPLTAGFALSRSF